MNSVRKESNGCDSLIGLEASGRPSPRNRDRSATFLGKSPTVSTMSQKVTGPSVDLLVNRIVQAVVKESQVEQCLRL